MTTKTTVTHHGIGFFGLLFIVLLALKLTGYIEIGWAVLFAILFAPALFFLLALAILGLLGLVAWILDR